MFTRRGFPPAHSTEPAIRFPPDWPPGMTLPLPRHTSGSNRQPARANSPLLALALCYYRLCHNHIVGWGAV
jgi:hypothetical protein